MTKQNQARGMVSVQRPRGLRKGMAVVLTVGVAGMALTPVAAAAQDVDDPLDLRLQASGASVATADGTELSQEIASESPAEKISVFGASEDDVQRGDLPHGEASGYLLEQNDHTGLGTEPLYNTDEEVDPDLIEAEGVEGDLVETETIKQSEMEPLTAEDFEPARAIAVTDSTISMTWELPDDAGSTTVLLEGAEVEHDGQDLALTGLTPGSVYQIELTHLSNVGDEQEVVRTDTHFLKTVAAGTVSPLVDDGAKQAVETAADYTRALAIRYRTFIMDSEVPSDVLTTVGCPGVPTNYYFGGDNRTYSHPGVYSVVETDVPSRSILQVKAELDAPPEYQDLIIDKKIGATHVLDENKDHVGTKTASADGIVVQNPQIATDSYARFGVSHEVTNPHCLAGAIRYTLNEVQIYKSGTITVEGSRVPVPAHELYGSFVNSDGTAQWRNMYRGAQGDFNCLIGTCVNEPVNGDASAT